MESTFCKTQIMKSGNQLFLLFFLLVFTARAQESFTFHYQQSEMGEVISQADIKKHPFGDDIAYKMQLLKESYTYTEPASTSASERIIIEKQPIFFSIKKLDKYLKKGMKKGDLSENDARTELENALNVALNIRYQDTKKLEDLLWKMKDPVQVSQLYKNIKLEM